MRVIVAGQGIQGQKRRKICGDEFVGFVDPFSAGSDFKNIRDVPLEKYDAVLACIPDEPKQDIVEFCIKNGKHVLVEKPLWFRDVSKFKALEEMANRNGVLCYIAYNHRFEPHFVNMARSIQDGWLGEIYRCRMFYGNGTARLVKESAWRDKGGGVLPDLGSHLLDTCKFWFGEEVENSKWEIVSANSFENAAPDHVIIGANVNGIQVELEMTMLMWKNHFTCDVLAHNGSVHIESLCKWGPTKYIERKRVFPSGKPPETQTILTQSDPTWELEYSHFKKLIDEKVSTNFVWHEGMYKILSSLEGSLGAS